MKKIFVTATLVFSSLLAHSTLAQEAETDLFNLCSKFPQNSKCKNFDAPMALENRDGEKASCQLILGDFQNQGLIYFDNDRHIVIRNL